MTGHASHKGSSAKPEGNSATVQIDLSPQDPQPESGYPYDADEETQPNPAALERGDRPTTDQSEEA